MEFGSLHMEEKKARFTTAGGKEHLVAYKDMVWAYQDMEGVQPDRGGIVIHTRKKEEHRIVMSGEEAQGCLKALKEKNPNLMADCPKGRRLPLNSLSNTRDLGGMQTEDGHFIRPCRLLRSGDLYHASESDQTALRREYKLRMVIDFRTLGEQKERPDAEIYGADYISNPILAEETMGITRERGGLDDLMQFQGDGEAYMEQLYENLVLDRNAQEAYGNFLRLLKHCVDGAAMWHCTAGKDRVGVGTALLLRILGVSMEDILEDYMRSEEYLEEDNESMLRVLERQRASRKVLKNVKLMLGVKEAYLQRAFGAIGEKYGTMEKYMKKALGLTTFDMNFLKDRYLF